MMIRYTLLPVLLLSIGGVYRTVDAASLRCYDGSFNSYSDFSLDDPTPLLNSSCYNSLRNTVICTHGFNSTAEGEDMKTLVEAYLCLGFNVILLNWQKEAFSGSLEAAGYPRVVLNAKIVGKASGRAYALLSAAGLGRAGLVGFSLGARVMNYAAGKYNRITGNKVQWLIGLDPAGPLFDGAVSLPGMDANSVGSMIIIHTNPGRLGSNEITQGAMDVWVNCGNPVQPGCAAAGGGIEITTPENMCSHSRSWRGWAEALQKPGTFIARAASSCEAWRKGQGGNQTITLGLINENIGLRGNFYLDTNAVPFYGRGEAGSYPN